MFYVHSLFYMYLCNLPPLLQKEWSNSDKIFGEGTENPDVLIPALFEHAVEKMLNSAVKQYALSPHILFDSPSFLWNPFLPAA